MRKPAEQKPLAKEPLAYNVQEFALATGMSVTKVTDAIRDGRITPAYWDSKPLIPYKRGVEFIDSLPPEKP